MQRRRSHAVLTGLAIGMAILLTSCILIVPDTRSKRHVRLELPTPAKNPTVSYMTVELEDLSCEQLRVVLNALPKRGRSWINSSRDWVARRRVHEVKTAIAARCSPILELPERP